MSMKRTPALLLLAMVLLSPAHASAVAICQITPTPVTIPANGAIPMHEAISLEVWGAAVMWCGIDHYEVTNAAGEVLTGSIVEVEGLGAYWWPETPFAPNAEYHLVAVEPDGSRTDALITTTETVDDEPTVTLDSASLTEWRQDTTSCCTGDCTGASGSCEYENQYCWAEAYAYWPSLSVTASSAGGERSLNYVSVVATAAGVEQARTNAVLGSAALAVNFTSSPSFPVCVSAQVRRIADQTVVHETEPTCFEASELTPIPREEVPLVNFGHCADPEQYADHPLNAHPGGNDGGCSLGGTTRPSWPLALAGLLGLLVMRRRRR